MQLHRRRISSADFPWYNDRSRGSDFPVAQFDAVDTVAHDLISGFLKHIRIGVLGLCCLYYVVSLKSTQLKPYPCTNSGRENGSCKDSNGDPASAFSFSVFCFILLKIPDFCSVLLFFSVFPSIFIPLMFFSDLFSAALSAAV